MSRLALRAAGPRLRVSYYADPFTTLYHGDCVAVMRELPDASVDAVVTDPPYNLSFMGKTWDSNHQHEPWAREAYRVAKPGAHLLAFGGTRTYHRLASAIEDAGWEIRDCLVWAYASGFPKSLDVSKAIDKAAGAEREVVGRRDRYLDGHEPPGGLVLDPFVGSGTTALAASEEGFRAIGIDSEAEYLEIAVGRLSVTAIGMGL